ncbi:MAG TPA: serine hydrolase domain-containing protein [Nocardioides sp.]|nr:serine hydrolase domain-containing protein [Nocardioides sp.]
MTPIHGTCAPAYDAVREAFAVVVDGAPAGSSLAIRYAGELVVDLWGGPAGGGREWQHDTLVMPYSVSKPLAAVCALQLVDRGLVELDAPMRRYWAELRSQATVRQVLAHSAGLVLLEEPAPYEAFLDWTELCDRLARQDSSWPPGTAVGESALFYGHLVGELVRRVDGRSLGRFLREEVASPHGLDLHIGVPDADQGRVADLVAGTGFTRAGGGPLRQAATANPPGTDDMSLMNSRAWRAAEVPAINAHVTARSIALFYELLASGRLLSPATLAEMTRVQASGDDLVTGHPALWGLGVSVDPDGWGMGGIGGSFGCWSPAGGYAFAFTTADLGTFDRVDALENAFRAVVGLAPIVG